MDSAINNTKKQNIHDTWQKVSKILRAQLGEDLYNSWFTRLEPQSLENGILTLTVPTLFLKSWIKSRYNDKILSLWKKEIADVRQIELRVRTHGEKLTNNQDHTNEEITEFLGSLNTKQFETIREFFQTMPNLRHEFDYNCDKCGCKEHVILTGIEDFFA